MSKWLQKPRKRKSKGNGAFLKTFEDPLSSESSGECDRRQLVTRNQVNINQLTMVSLSMAIKYIQLSSLNDLNSLREFKAIFNFFYAKGLLLWSPATLDQFISMRPQHEKVFVQLMKQISSNSSLTQIDLSPLSLYPINRSPLSQSSVLASQSTGWYLQNFDEKGVLGRGAFGVVYHARNKVDRNDYAVKVIRLRSLQLRELHRVQREVATLCQLDHPNIVRYHTSWTEIKPRKFSAKLAIEAGESSTDGTSSEFSRASLTQDNVVFQRSSSMQEGSDANVSNVCDPESETSSQHVTSSSMFSCDIVLFIQMQLCDTSLSQLLESRNSVSVEDPFTLVDDAECHSIFKQLLRGLDYIHSKGILHRDIKSSNVFLQSETLNHSNDNGHRYRVRIGDFGLARPVEDARGDCGHLKMSLVGTASYQSPELRAGRVYDQRTDLFSLGVILFELYQPFCSGHEKQDLVTQLRTKHTIPQALSHRFSHEAAVILQLTDADPSLRPSAGILLKKWNYANSKQATISKLLVEVKEAKTELFAERQARFELEQEIIRLKESLAAQHRS